MTSYILGQLSNLEGHFNNVETELKANLSRNFQQLNGKPLYKQVFIFLLREEESKLELHSF